ncbi:MULTISPECIES: recombinase family protein [Arthrobacter]|uniref:Recombinase family protein n=1 Tax=Arthrobacter terricola TaxID=2547396 RepID=A0A4V2ZSE0_9MICC|nr:MULTISPECIES: recombinase family protein [Arthrobacter]MBT8162546.1 recombinase family protein [Arthrobacter sp. GN70]TDF92894.1 recombinase family protein [Arthrobacter terricola]
MEQDKDGANARAAIYTRISKDLTLEGLGVTRQLEDCLALAERKGWSVLDEKFEDNDISAAGGKKREGYNRLKAVMEAGEVDVVVVYAADRLHRNSRELEDWIDLASETGINIYSATNGFIDLSNPDGRTMARVVTAFAAGEVEKTKMRLIRKHLELAEAGAWPGQACYGYTADAEIVPEEAAVITEMAARVLHGEGLNAIAKDFTARGIPTARGAAWRAASIRNILKSPRIAGLRVHRGKVSAKGQWAGIISEETSAMLRARFAPGRSDGIRGGARKHLLTGLLVCSKCGTGMVKCINGRTKKESYRCPKNEGSAACGGTTIVSAETEAWLAEAAFQFQDARVVGQTEATSEWLEQTGALDARLEEIASDYALGSISRSEWQAARAAVERAKSALPVPIIRPRNLTTGAMLRVAWDGMATSVRRAILDDIFVKVVVMPRRQVTGPKSFDAGRIVPEWRQ